MQMGNKQNKPVIGITPSFDTGDHFPDTGVRRMFLRQEYFEMVVAVGAFPLVLDPAMSLDDVMSQCDGIIISGGENIHPTFYGTELLEGLGFIEPAERYVWEANIIAACDESTIPILGVCYGMQRLNTHYGGTLIQDIDRYQPENVGHWQTTHSISFTREFLGMKEKGVHDINSRHHQAIERLADGFQVCATAPDGIIEAIEGHGHYGMQWHPESDETGAHVYRAFVEECLRRKNAIDPVQL
jgi:putative glutamine amidotransferase